MLNFCIVCSFVFEMAESIVDRQSMDEIAKLVTRATNAQQSKDNNGLVSQIETILESLKSLGLAYKERLHPKSVGVHWANRYGMGIVGSWMHKLGSSIVRMGWSNTACVGAVCIEDSNNRCAKFTRDLQIGSSYFGQSEIGEIKFGSLACGHTNQFLNAVLSGVECEYEELCINGRMSKNRIIETQPSMDEPLNRGMLWLVLKKEVGDLFPKLPALIQSARQAIGQVQHGESHFELMEGIQSFISSANDPKSINWKAIEKQLARSESKFAEDLPLLCEYVRMYGGGTSGVFVRRLNAFVSHCINDNRYIAASTFTAIVKLKGLQSNEYCPNFMTAVHHARRSTHHGGPLGAPWGDEGRVRLYVACCFQRILWCSKRS